MCTLDFYSAVYVLGDKECIVAITGGEKWRGYIGRTPLQLTALLELLTLGKYCDVTHTHTHICPDSMLQKTSLKNATVKKNK